MQRTAALFLNIICVSMFLVFTQPALGVSFEKPNVPAPRVMFDDAHGQSFGNADWTPFHAYSDLAGDLEKVFSASIFSLGLYNNGILSPEILKKVDLLIIPEPNIRYSESEQDAIRRFVSSGGSLFLIADHGGSDRNFDGWDSCVIFNEITDGWGISFLGDSFSETPVRGRRAYNCSVVNPVQSVGAWAATSIVIEPDTWHWLSIRASEKTGFPFIVRGDIGMGRVVAIGDSSAFDDGSGDATKNRHSAYHSWMFNQRKLAICACSWLLDLIPQNVPEPELPFPDRTKPHTLTESSVRLVIDACRGNNDADLMNRFGANILSNLGIPGTVNLTDYSDLRSKDILLLTNPSSPLSPEDLTILSSWVREQGGKLILTGASARNPLSNTPDINRLLEEVGSTMRLNADQILDHGSNTGRPWSPKIPIFAPISVFNNVESAVFWGCASVVNTDGKRLRDSASVKVLAWTSQQAYSEVKPFFTVKGGIALPKNPTTKRALSDPNQKPQFPLSVPSKSIPVTASERVGNGVVVLLGADPFTNFQYPTEAEKANLDRSKWDHHTAEFNLALLRILINL